jgi:hypothetical protein
MPTLLARWFIFYIIAVKSQSLKGSSTSVPASGTLLKKPDDTARVPNSLPVLRAGNLLLQVLYSGDQYSADFLDGSPGVCANIAGILHSRSFHKANSFSTSAIQPIKPKIVPWI